MRTLEPTEISNTLQEDLTKYGLVVAKATEKAPINTKKPNFFGIRNDGGDKELIFSESEKTLTDSGVQVAVLAPDIDSFDMLLTKDFPDAVKRSDYKTLREFISKLLDEIKL